MKLNPVLQILLVSALLSFWIGGAWAIGLRFHPEVFSHKKPAQFLKINLKSGGSIVGKLIREDEREIMLRIPGGSAAFAKNEIAASKKIQVQDLSEEEQEALKVNSSFITLRREDSLFYNPPLDPNVLRQLANAPQSPSRFSSQMTSTTPTSGGFGDLLSQTVQTMSNYKKSEEIKKQQIMRQMEEMGEGSSEGSGGSPRASSIQRSSGSDEESSSSQKVDATGDTGFEFDIHQSR